MSSKHSFASNGLLAPGRSLAGLVCLFFLSSATHAQSGGGSTFQFLQLQAPARIQSLGGSAISTPADDLSLIGGNPAQLSDQMHRQLAFSQAYLPAGIRHGLLQTAYKVNSVGMLAGQLQYIQYGTFTRTDENGNVIGEFSAAEYAFQLGWSRSLDSAFRIGANAKFISSAFDDQRSNGVAADAGLFWNNKRHLLSAALVVRNAGRQLKTWSSTNREELPLDIQAGISKQLSKAPFRFSLILQQLNKRKLDYVDPDGFSTDPLTGEVQVEQPGGLQRFSRRVILNTEILLSKNFNVRFGYNFLRRNEMSFASRKGLAGISLGTGFRINRFQLAYALSVYNTAGTASSLTISTGLERFKKR
ncbi:MAG: type IX secretion system protein PorQ [Bacteroidota bacterium]|jgi:hypothetical protein